MRPINLVPAAHRRARQRRLLSQAWVRVGVAYSMALVAAVVVVHAGWGHSDRTLTEEIADLQQRIERDSLRLSSAHAQILHADRELRAAREMARQPDWSLLLALLAEVRDEQISIDRISLRPESSRRGDRSRVVVGQPKAYQLELGGTGENQQAVTQFALRLEETGLFDDVQLVETHRTSVNEQPAVAYALRCRISEGDNGGGRP